VVKRAWLAPASRRIEVLVLVLACGCATQIAVKRPGVPTEGALYDAAAEWQSDNRQPAGTPAPPPLFVAEPQWNASSLEVSLTQLSRIRSLQRFVHAAAHAHAVPADLVNGIIWVESRFQVNARGRKGPRGLMQLMPGTAREVARTLGMRYQPYDPEFNINAGTYYFARMVDRFDGQLDLALAAYNIGPGTVANWVRDSQPLPVVSRTYVDNVFNAARFFRARPP
jgi:soluble lytic murein transglycosylase-like protein